MNITAKTFDAAGQKSDCLVVGVYEGNKLTPSAAALDKLCDGYIKQVLKRGDLDPKPGQGLLLMDLEGIAAPRVLLMGCGKARELTANKYRNILAAMVTRLNEVNVKDAVCYLTDVEVKDRDEKWKARQIGELCVHGNYRFDQLKTEDPGRKPSLRKLTLHPADTKQTKAVQQAGKVGAAIAEGMTLTRDLGNLPGNVCTPTYLANQAKKLGKDYDLKVTVLGEKEMEKLGMGSLLSVAKGSRQPPKFIVMEYNRGKKPGKPIVLVGKGITFDAGGISIKPSEAMDEMKFDMCGAASVFGTLKALGELQLPLNVVGIVPTCENLPDGNANKPGDIVTSMSGQTIEILNTDAEGRLVLCDALTYSERYEPKAVIDIATLTGACIIALGNQACGVLGNDQALVDSLLQAGEQSADRGWQLPLWDEYQEQLKSNFADMANIGGRPAGTITAACFLSRFTNKLKWVHLDIAGVAWNSGDKKGATGRPVPLLTQYLLQQAGKA
jgi:leucyl aminopeptidase